MTSKLYGCIEAGGTKFVLGLASGPEQIVAETKIPTTTPDETLSHALKWMKLASAEHGVLSGIGIATFGPAELDRAHPHWGFITGTPKPHWSNTRFAGVFADAFGVPVGFETDVNGAVLGEARWGAGQDHGQGHRLVVYVTIGTGIGGGIAINGTTVHGLSHPEMGHMRMKRHPDDLGFAGVCPFHGDCFEGLASGPAIKARWGASLSELPSDHLAHEIIAFYIGQLVNNLQATLEPNRIILGGGVMGTAGLLERVHDCATDLGAGYFKGKPKDIVVLPGLGERSGLLGALSLAMDASA
jgi:fructokinase